MRTRPPSRSLNVAVDKQSQQEISGRRCVPPFANHQFLTMPVPTIFLIGDDNQIVEMKDQPYDSEELLQQLLAKCPGVLAGDQMSGSAPLQRSGKIEKSRSLLIEHRRARPGGRGQRCPRSRSTSPASRRY